MASLEAMEGFEEDDDDEAIMASIWSRLDPFGLMDSEDIPSWVMMVSHSNHVMAHEPFPLLLLGSIFADDNQSPTTMGAMLLAMYHHYHKRKRIGGISGM